MRKVRRFARGFFPLIGKAFRYNLIRSAALVKIIQATLELTGYAPWTPARAEAVELTIDMCVGIAVLYATGQAHNNPTPSICPPPT